MKLDLKDLKAKAEAATPGPWGVTNGDRLFGDFDNPANDGDDPYIGQIASAQDRQFVAAFNPQVALALIERVEKLENSVLEFDTTWGKVKCHDDEYVWFPRFFGDNMASAIKGKKTIVRVYLAELDAEDVKS